MSSQLLHYPVEGPTKRLHVTTLQRLGDRGLSSEGRLSHSLAMAVDQNRKIQSPELFLYSRFRLETRPRVDLPVRIL
jgi:hypothetical protein